MSNKRFLIVMLCVSIFLISESVAQSIHEDKIVWGETTHGLQGGIYIPTRRWIGGKPQQPRVADVIKPIYFIRNVSGKSVECTIFHPLADWPRILNIKGADVHFCGGGYDGPAHLTTYRLKDGDCIELHKNTFMLAPRIPVFYHTGGTRKRIVALTVPGTYRIAYQIKVHTLNGLKMDFNLASGWAKLTVLPPDRKELTKKVVEVLRPNADRFNLKIFRVADDHSPLRSLKLTVLKPERNYPKFWSVVRITREEAIAIIEFLEQSDYLWRSVTEPANPAYNKASLPPELLPYYCLTFSLGDESKPSQLLGHAHIHLGWGPDLYGRLRKLQNVLRGNAKKAMKELLAQVEPFRGEWKERPKTNVEFKKGGMP